MAAHRKQMTISLKFCTACGSPVAAGMRFCSQCGLPVVVQGTAAPARQPQQPAAPAPAAPGGGERILGIVPFLEQGLLSVIHYTLIVTDRRLIFCTWDPDKDEAMSEADDTMMQESCTISETKDEIAHFLAKDWSRGPWQRYRSMAADAIIAGAPGSIIIPDDYASIATVPTIHNHSQAHAMPGIDAKLSAEVAACIPKAQQGGTYVQTSGPRIETKAEVRALSRMGDVVGMTIASEATLANELGIPFSACCMVDNFAHGIGTDELSYEQILNCARANTKKTEQILEQIITRIG